MEHLEMDFIYFLIFLFNFFINWYKIFFNFDYPS